MTRAIDGTWSKFVWNLSGSESLARKFRDGKACFVDLRLAVEAQPTLTPSNEWVSVEERLPEYNPGTGAKSYWVAKKDNAGNWQMKIAQYCDYGYAMTMDAETEVTWRDWDFTKIANVTHWMPLPAPPDSRPPEGEEVTRRLRRGEDQQCEERVSSTLVTRRKLSENSV